MFRGIVAGSLEKSGFPLEPIHPMNVVDKRLVDASY